MNRIVPLNEGEASAMSLSDLEQPKSASLQHPSVSTRTFEPLMSLNDDKCINMYSTTNIKTDSLPVHNICRVQKIEAKKNVKSVDADGVFWQSTEAPQHSGNTATRCIPEKRHVYIFNEAIMNNDSKQAMAADKQNIGGKTMLKGRGGGGTHSRKMDIVSDDISHPK